MSDWFQDSQAPGVAGKEVRVGGGVEWSLIAWQKAFHAWERHGKENHLLFASESEEQNMRDLQEKFFEKVPKRGTNMPPTLREEELPPDVRKQFHAAKYLFEYDFYRNVSNFAHHYIRSGVEKEPETITCRKFFYQAVQSELAGSPRPALEIYRTPVEAKAWPGKQYSPLLAWRDLVLLRNKAYRRDNWNQEHAAEVQLRYLRLHNRFDGRVLKGQVTRASAVLPLLPKMDPTDDFRMPIVEGPFDVPDDEGKRLIEDVNMTTVLDRLNLAPRKPAPPPTKE